MTETAPKPIADCPNPECSPEHYTHQDHFGVFRDTHYKTWAVSCICGYRGPDAATDAEAIRLHNLIACPQQSAEPVEWQLLRDGENCGITTDAEIRDSWPIEIKGASVRELFAASPGPSELVEEMELRARHLIMACEPFMCYFNEHVAMTKSTEDLIDDMRRCADRLSALITRHRGKS